jgi:RNA polymerase sigma-70 factor (ECF subfamily)
LIESRVLKVGGCSEEELVERAHAGDREAFGELLQLYQRRVYSFVRRLVWRQDEAVEVAQEVFLQAYKSRQRFRPGRPFRPWLFRIAVNTAHNHIRKRARSEEPQPLAAHDVGLWHVPVADAEETLVRRDQLRIIGAAMEKLRPRDRALLLLRFGEGLSFAELSEVYGEVQSVLKMRVHRALSRLRQAAKADLR